MTKREIVARLGRERRVEQIILRIAGVERLTADLEDLAQMVYLTLLEYDEAKLVDLWDSDAINFLIVRLVLFNLRSKTSRYYYIIKIFSARTTDLAPVEYKTDEG
jgi:hypothetical protein